MTPLRLRVRELRQRIGLTQEQLAKKAGVRRATVVDLESSKNPAKRIDLATLEKLGRALGTDPGLLIVRDTKR